MSDWIAEVERRLRGARLDGAAEREIAEELAQHLQDRFDELKSSGLSAADARAQALAELGDADQLAQRVRRVRAAALEPVPIGAAGPRDYFGGMLSDVRFGARMLRRTPLYTIVAMLVLALGIGATTVIFSAVNSLLLTSLPGVREPDELAVVFTSDYSGPRYGASSHPDYEAIRDDADIFAHTAAFSLNFVSVVGEGWNQRAAVEVVTADYFAVLGVAPAAGRMFTADESVVGQTTRLAVVSEHLAKQQFGDAASAVGKTVRVRGEPVTIIGVAGGGFRGSIRGLAVDVWVPISAPESLAGGDVTHRGNRGFSVVGRLRDGVTIETAQSRLAVLAARLHQAYPEAWTDINDRSRVFTIVSEKDARVPPQMRGAAIGFLAVLMGAVVTVLLIACTNVANLMLSRAASRQTEMGIRVALGATRGRIMRHMLAESLLLALLGGATGVLLATWLTRLVGVARLPMPIPLRLQLDLDVRVLAFATAITLLTGVLFGLAPALQASRSPAPALKGDKRSGGTRLRMRHALVVVQVAASLVLLVGGGLFLRSLNAAQRIDPGFDPENIVLANFQLSAEGYSDEQSAQFYEQLQERVGGLRGTRSITLAESVPLSLGYSRRGISVEGYEPQPGEDMEVMYNGVTPGYFKTMGVRLRRGREFTSDDRANAPLVVIVTEAFARRFWGDADAIGKRVSFNGAEGPFAEVVGIAPDGKYRSLTEEPQPYVYFPYPQNAATDMTLLVRAVGDPDLVVAALRSEARAIAPSLPPPTITTMRQHLTLATLPQRIAGVLLTALGVLAIIIAAIGLYGLVAFGAAQRAREFGIRMALGAVAGDVRRLVIRHALSLVLLGILCGVPVAVAVALLIHTYTAISAKK